MRKYSLDNEMMSKEYVMSLKIHMVKISKSNNEDFDSKINQGLTSVFWSEYYVFLQVMGRTGIQTANIRKTGLTAKPA